MDSFCNLSGRVAFLWIVTSNRLQYGQSVIINRTETITFMVTEKIPTHGIRESGLKNFIKFYSMGATICQLFALYCFAAAMMASSSALSSTTGSNRRIR